MPYVLYKSSVCRLAMTLVDWYTKWMLICQSFSLNIPVHSYIRSPSLESKIINSSIFKELFCEDDPWLMSLWVLWINVCVRHLSWCNRPVKDWTERVSTDAAASLWERTGLCFDCSPSPWNLRYGCMLYWRAPFNKMLTTNILLVESMWLYIRYNHN